MADLVLKILMEAVDRATGPLRSGARAAGELKAAVAGGTTALADLDRSAALTGFGDKAGVAQRRAQGLRAASEAAARIHAGAKGGPLADEVKATVADLDRLQQASKRLDGFALLTQRADASAKALDAAREKATRLGRELAQTEAPTKAQAAAFDKARKAVTDHEAAHRRDVVAVQTTRGELARLGYQLRSGANEAASLDQAQRKVRQSLTATTAAATRQAEAIEAAAERERRAIEKVEATERRRAANRTQLDKTLQTAQALSVAGMAGYAAGSTALGQLGQTVAPGVDFQAQMSKVGALASVDKTTDDYAKLEAQAIELGAKTAFSASQAADAQGQLAATGFKTQQILAAMPGMLDLAKAAGYNEVGETATIAANVLNAFKLQAGQMGDAADVLAFTFTNSATTLGDLGETMKYVGPIAQAAGYSLGDMAAAAGLLGNVGIKGSEGGTALRAMIQRLAAPTGQAAAMIEKLGLSTKDARGNLLPLDQILEQLAKKTEKLGNSDRLGVMKTLFGEEASAAGNALADAAGSGAYRDTLKKQRADGKGTNSRIALQMNDNLKGDLDGLSGSVETLQIVIEKINDGPLRNLTQTATEWVNVVTGWTQDNPVLVSTLMTVAAAFAAIVAVGGALTLSIGAVLGPFAMLRFGLQSAAILLGPFGGGLAAVGRGVLAVLPVVWSFTAALLACPITWIVGGIAALAGAAYLIYANWGDVAPWFQRQWDNITTVFGGFLTFFTGVFTGNLAQAWDGITAMFGGLGNIVLAQIDAVKGIFGGLLGWIDATFGTNLLGSITAVVDGIRAVFEGLFGPVDAVLQKILGAVQPVIDAAKTVGGFLGLGDTGAKPAPLPANTNIPVANTNIPAGAGVRAVPTAAASARLTGAGAVNQTSYNEITIHAAPGMDEKAVAQAVGREMDARDRRQASATRSRYADGL